MVESRVLARHPLGREASLGSLTDPGPIKSEAGEHLPCELLRRVRAVAGDPLVDDLRHRAETHCDDRGAAHHRLDQDEPEWLWVGDRVQQRPRPTEEPVPFGASDGADVLYRPPVHQRLEVLPVVVVVRPREQQTHPEDASSRDSLQRALPGGKPPEKADVVLRLRLEGELA